MIDFGTTLGREFSEGVTDTEGLPQSSRREELREGSVRQDPRRKTVIELIGDVGAGKTTFVRGLAKGLGIKEPITSPSFTISKSYAFKDKEGKEKNLVHYDFYRLGDPGLMANDLADSINNPDNLVVIEWADSIDEILPENRLKITINYNEDNTREVTIS